MSPACAGVNRFASTHRRSMVQLACSAARHELALFAGQLLPLHWTPLVDLQHRDGFMPPIDYTKTCFVIMPFGTKPVGKHKVNFDRIYDQIFKPAIAAVALPEGGKLRPSRTDKDFFSGDIGQEMFQYLNDSRFALVDITGLNPNVMYEIGIRHAVRDVGHRDLSAGRRDDTVRHQPYQGVPL